MKLNKKLLSLVLAVLVIGASLTAGMIAYAGNPVAINVNNFPDENFRTIVTLECDEDGDGYLSDSELSGVTLFSVTGYLYDLDEDAEIESIEGIEYFTNLRTLRCGGIGLTSLDVSGLTGLTWLDCMGNELTELDVSKNTALRTLNCQSNELTSIDVTKNTALTTFNCSVNELTELDVTQNTLLDTLQVHQNELTELDLSENTALTSLHCSNNHMKMLDLSANTALTNVTSNRIGDQTITGVATVSSGSAFVDMAFRDRTKIVATSLDVESVAYNGQSFYTTDLTKLQNGIDYEYDTGAPESEPMTVHIDVERDFFVVRFYTNENLTTLLDQQIVNRGETAIAPTITETPLCKTFVAWNSTLDNVQEDRNIYATWKDDHVFKVTNYDDNNIIMTCQNGCGTSTQVNFFDVVGAEYGDSNYDSAIDLNADGFINGRDLAILVTGKY